MSFNNCGLLLLAVVVSVCEGNIREVSSDIDMVFLPTRNHAMPEARIIGGEAVPKPISWMASLQMRPNSLFYYGHICGGSLIDKQHVLTAAHCIMNTDVGVQKALSQDFRVAIGGLRQSSTRTDDEFQYRHVSGVYCHPGFSDFNKDDDVCVLKLDKPTNLSPVSLNIPNVPAANLSNAQVATNEQAGSMLTVMGWGLTDEKDDTSLANGLRIVSVPIIPQEACINIYGSRVITPNQLCAGYLEGGKDACQGDSGGPAISDDGVQVGVTSYGAGCAEAMLPGVYTRISDYSKFIQDAVNGKLSNSVDSAASSVAESPSSTTGPESTQSDGATESCSSHNMVSSSLVFLVATQCIAWLF